MLYKRALYYTKELYIIPKSPLLQNIFTKDTYFLDAKRALYYTKEPYKRALYYTKESYKRDLYHTQEPYKRDP